MHATRPRREDALDMAERADIIMVTPQMSFLDILRRLRDSVTVPIASTIFLANRATSTTIAVFNDGMEPTARVELCERYGAVPPGQSHLK